MVTTTPDQSNPNPGVDNTIDREESGPTEDMEETSLHQAESLVPPSQTTNQESSNDAPEDNVPLNSLFQDLARPDILMILLISFVFATSISGTIGVVPLAIADRYARINHGHTGLPCDSFEIKPPACQAGTDDAQAMASWANVGMSIVGVLLNPVIGKLSDDYGRRPAVLLSLTLYFLCSVVFWYFLCHETTDPLWFFFSQSLANGVSLLGVIFASLSDIATEDHRAVLFGLFLGSCYAAFALAPAMPIILSHTKSAATCAVLALASLLLAIPFYPETMKKNNSQESPPSTSTDLQTVETTRTENGHYSISILNRNTSTQLLAAGTLISSMVYASDHTLVLYYIEDRLDFGDSDIAVIFVIVGITGALLQALALQPMLKCFGEKGLLVGTFVSGAVHNFCYGIARGKGLIFVAIALAQFTKLNYPLLSSYASKQADSTEQGQLQGAISAVNAIGTAIGPLSMEVVYHFTKRSTLGPGFMFVCASVLYGIGAGLLQLIPKTRGSSEDYIDDNSNGNQNLSVGLDEAGDLEEPLIRADNESME